MTSKIFQNLLCDVEPGVLGDVFLLDSGQLEILEVFFDDLNA